MRKSSSGPFDLSALYDLVGGFETCQRLSDRFHERVAQDERLRPIFPKEMRVLSERFALFIGERLGGPATYSMRRGKQSLICRHAHLSISTQEANRWLSHFFAAMDEVGIAEPARQPMREFLTETARTLTDPFLPFYGLPLIELRTVVEEQPELLLPSSMGHSLLREAVGRWDVPRVQLLLESGASAMSEEPVGHGLLYRAANSNGNEADGGQVVELLIRHGAGVNRSSGPGKSTPLHMAARRGHVLLAEILLRAGADIEAKDAKGETPLRRAVNCRQHHLARFLLAQGANALSQDRHGRTPDEAARAQGRDLLTF